MTPAPTTGRVTEPLAVGTVGLVALIAVDPPDVGVPWCPSAIIFGVACPLCGLTRGVARLVRGDVAASIEFHPLAWLVLAVIVGAWLAWLGRRAGWWRWRSIRTERWTVSLATLGLVATWVYRATTETLPPI